MPQLRYKLKLDPSAADSALTDHATRVGTASISAAKNTAIFSTDTGNGADVWFSSDEAGTTPIDAKLVYWSDGSSVFAFDVEITSISAVSGATIYLHVGSKPGGYGTNPYRAATKNYCQFASDFDDLTTNALNGSAVGGVSAGGITGPDGLTPATDFDGTSQAVDYTLDVATTGTTVTLSGWAKVDSLTRDHRFAGIFNVSDPTNQSFLLWMDTDGGGDGWAGIVNAGGVNLTTTDFSRDTATTDWQHIAMTFSPAQGPAIYLNGTLDTGPATPARTILSPPTANYRVGAMTGASASSDFFGGGISGVRLDSEIRSPAEIKADYLLQGSSASTYWTVTDVTPALPAATFDLRSDREVVRSGSDVTSWGNASGGTSPTYSNEPADRILGFPAIQFDAASTQYLEWDEIASMFSGDDPDWTVAIVYRAVSGAGFILSASQGTDSQEQEFIQSSTPTVLIRRETGDGSPQDLAEVPNANTGQPYLIIAKSESGVGSLLVRRLDTDAEASDSNAYDQPSLTLGLGTIGARRADGTTKGYVGVDIARIRLYNTALGGDLTGDLTGTQLGALKTEMLLPSGGSGSLEYASYHPGLHLRTM